MYFYIVAMPKKFQKKYVGHNHICVCIYSYIWETGVLSQYRSQAMGWTGGKTKGFFSLQHRGQTGSGIHSASYSMGAGGSFSRVKVAEAWS
jgi:hypothetical protein